jgi:PAS domain S-box-containing protein
VAVARGKELHMSCIDHLSELEALRLQVADLTRALAERTQSMSAERRDLVETIQDLREQSQLLRTIIEGTAAETGDEFFASLVRHLTSTLHVQYAVIGEVCEGPPKKIRTLAVAAGGTLVDNFEYDLADTPCAAALTEAFACFDRDVQAMFPQFQRLADLGAKSYCAVPFPEKDGVVRGLLAVMDTKPLQQIDDLQSLLGLLAPRVAAEFERKQVEEERTQALADLRNVVETVPDIMFTLDTQGNMVKWNRRVVDVTGYSPEELLNMPALAFVPPEEQPRTAEAIQRAFTEGYAELDGYLLTKEHRVIPYHWTGALLKSPQGDPIGITGVGRDVSDKKRAEVALRESQERLALAVAGSTDILWDAHRFPDKPWYAPQTPIWWSPGVRELLGLEESESFETLEQWAGRLHPEDKERVFSQLTAHIEQRVPYDAEYRLLTNRGDYRWIRGRGQALWDEQGEVRRMSGSCQDITDRKRAEETIGEAELRYRTIFEQAGAGVAQIESHTGRFVQINRRYCEIVGLTEAEMLATTLGVITHPDDLQSDLENMTRLLRGEIRSFTMEKRYVRPDGDIVWVNLNVAPLWRAGERPSHHIAIVEDITERKQTDEALIRSEQQLRSVLDALPVGVWFTDQSGRPVLSNPAAKQIWTDIKQVGIETTDDNSGWWEAVGSSDAFHRWALSQSLTKGIPSLNETLDLECLDGRIKTIRNTTVPVQGTDGDILGAIVLNEDMTALRQMQKALKLTQSSVDHAVEGFLWIDSDARILNVNDATCRMLEYTRDELTTMTVHDIDPNLSRELWPAQWETLKRKGSVTFESKHWSKSGRVLDTEITVTCLDYEGRQYGCAIMRDIGERKRVENALRQSEERYRSLVDNAPIGIFLNEGGRFIYANREMLRILKATSAEQLIGTPVLARIAPESHTAVNDCIRELVLGQPVSSMDEKLVALDGSQVDVAVSAIPTSLDGNPVMQVLALDITERKQLAEREISHSRQLKKLYELSMTLSGDPGVVLDHAVRIIGELFKVQVVCLSEIVGQELYFKSVCINGQTFSDAGHCPLAITPCAAVEQARDLQIFDCVMERFPEASFLRDYEAVSYCGFPALDSNGRVVAVTCLLDNKPREFSKEEQDLLRIFGQRIATEIERSHHTAEQKRAEKELRESHAFIRQIIDTHPNFIFAKDREGRFTLVNKAVADVYGTTVENLIGKTDADFNSNQEEVASFCQQDLAVMDTLHELFLPEEVITGFDGRTRWLQTVKRPIFDDEGRATMVLGSSTDITERKRMEETLRQREHDLRAALEGRERISQDLHDGILQSLFAVGLALESVKLTMSARNLKTSRASLNQAINQLNDVMREIRNFIAGLGSDLLKGRDLPAALQHMLETLTENQTTRVRLAVEDRAAKALSTEQSLHLLRVIQEAVGNCIRHGRAQEARVSLKMLKQGVRLSIRDDGRGFNLSAAKGAGHGLTNMAARAQKIGGRLTILSKVNEGTRVVLDLPNEAVLAFH